MTLVELWMIGLGGFAGTWLRYVITQKANRSTSFPTGTLIVNLLGAFLIGFVISWPMPTSLRYFLIPGFAGALTTFSTVKKEILELWQKGNRAKAILYLISTYMGGFIVTAIGWRFSSVLL